ncbi:nucleotidyltransferase domain-containing protein [Candidatus Woesearchaeota archaeon]|nr:nucleotidyltransferase domain-containing protein [Candidatus Woesearchaeota archaeon]
MFKELNTLRIFFENPIKEYNVREAAKALGIAPATASAHLKQLAKKTIVEERKDRMMTLYKANIDSSAYRDIKTYYNIRLIRESGLLEALNETYLTPTIVLFGSMSTGYNYHDSDIDLVVLSIRKGEFPKMDEFTRKLHRELHIFSVSKLEDLKNPHLISNVLNGVVLQGQWTFKSASEKELFAKFGQIGEK